MTEAIVLVPGILAWWVVASQSQQAALLGVYLPVLLLIPDYFHLPIDGLPDPTFSQCAILPIGIALVWNAVVKGKWHFSKMDFVVLAYVGWAVISDLWEVTYQDAQNFMFDIVTMAIFPYMAGKALIEPTGFRCVFARRFVWLLFMVSVLSIYEFRMAVSLFRPLLQGFFPSQNAGGWFTLLRWGFGRVAGPYGSPILMAVIVAMGYLLNRWLARAGLWERRFKWSHWFPFSKPQTLAAGLLIGMFMTLSRGPWLGAFCGLVLASIGTSANRTRAFFRAATILFVGGVVLYLAGKVYIQGDRMTAAEEKASAAYRAELLEEYKNIALQHPVTGWGRGNWPTVPGMKSIDNHYLLVALDSGLVGTALFALMLAFAVLRLFTRTFWNQYLAPQERAFRFTLLGIIATVAISVGTVWLGSQLFPLLFLFLGWSEAACCMETVPVPVLRWCMARPPRTPAGPVYASPYRFERIVT